MFRKILGFSLVLFALPAFAGDISYNFVEFGYQKIDFDEDITPGVSIDGNGYGIGGSFEIGESWFVGVGYSKADFDFDVELNQISAGVGWHTMMSNNADFYAMLDYVRAEAKVPGFPSIDDDGIGAEIGVRGMVTDSVEIGGSIAYVDFGDGGDNTAFGAHVVYNFTENFGAGLFIDIDEDVKGYGAGVRIYW